MLYISGFTVNQLKLSVVSPKVEFGEKAIVISRDKRKSEEMMAFSLWAGPTTRQRLGTNGFYETVLKVSHYTPGHGPGPIILLSIVLVLVPVPVSVPVPFCAINAINVAGDVVYVGYDRGTDDTPVSNESGTHNTFNGFRIAPE